MSVASITTSSVNSTENNTKYTPFYEELNSQVGYWLFLGIPIVINLIVLIYITRWIYLKVAFKYWRYIFCYKSRKGKDYDRRISRISYGYMSRGLRSVSRDLRSWLRNKIQRFLDYPVSRQTSLYKRAPLTLDDQYNEFYDNCETVSKNLQSSQHYRPKNVIALRELSAKYDSVLLQLSAMSFNTKFKCLLRAMNRFDTPKEKRMFDLLLKHSVHKMTQIIPNHDYRHTKHSRLLTTFCDEDRRYTKIKPLKPYSRKTKRIGKIYSICRNMPRPCYVNVGKEPSEGHVYGMKDMHSDRKLYGNIIETTSHRALSTYCRSAHGSSIQDQEETSQCILST